MKKENKILIIEDDASIRELLIEILKNENYEIIFATNGQEGLDILSQTSELPQLIILDLMMPIKDGRAFRAEQLTNKKINKIPVIMMSADNNFDFIDAHYYLKKPFDLEELLETVKTVFKLVIA